MTVAYTPGSWAVERSTGLGATTIRLAQPLLRRNLATRLQTLGCATCSASSRTSSRCRTMAEPDPRLGGSNLIDFMFRWNHAFIIVGRDGETIEMGPKGAERGIVGNRNVAIMPPPDPTTGSLVVMAAQHLIKDKVTYGWLDYASETAITFGKHWGWAENRANDGTTMICSQSVDWCCEQSGWHLFNDNRRNGDVVPSDLGLLIGLRRLGIDPRRVL